MKLHNDKKLMAQLIRTVSEYYDIKLEFIEKDYWITQILQELSRSKYVEQTVFKGGTSLAKAFKLINRFSEDVDLALCHTSEQSGNSIKSIIRGIEKAITNDLMETPIAEITSKGSRFRKSVYSYETVLGKDVTSNGSVIVEINSFANPYPFVQMEMDSIITQYLREIEQQDAILEYDLESFSINVLDSRQTLIEKLVSLIRFSHLGVDGLSSKIRHFYDIYYLMQDDKCREYATSDKFISEFRAILEHDKDMFTDPDGWQDRMLKDIPMFDNTADVWSKLAPKYRAELSELAFSPIPDDIDILHSFEFIANILKKHDL